MTYHQLKYLLWSVVVGVTLSLTSCMKWDYGDAVEDFNATGAGLFITNEGNFQYGNATLSYYDPATKQVQNEIFFRANGMKLGDVAQSMAKITWELFTTTQPLLSWMVIDCATSPSFMPLARKKISFCTCLVAGS